MTRPKSYMFDLESYDRVTPEIKALVEEFFPREFYGEDILVYEAWGMRHIIELAMLIAVEQEQDTLEAKLQAEADKYAFGSDPWRKTMTVLESVRKVRSDGK